MVGKALEQVIDNLYKKITRCIRDFAVGTSLFAMAVSPAYGCRQKSSGEDAIRSQKPFNELNTGWIYFVSNKFGEDIICYVDLRNEAKKIRKLELAVNVTPRNIAVNSDGSMLAFDNASDIHSDIYTYNLKTKHLKNITNSPERESEPSWSPKENRLCFTLGSSPDCNLCTSNSDGTHRTKLTDTIYMSESDGSWSQDGEKIVFVNELDVQKVTDDGSIAISRSSDIWLMDKYGKNSKQITTDGDAIEPAYGPNEKVAYISRGFNNELKLVDLKTFKVIKLTDYSKEPRLIKKPEESLEDFEVRRTAAMKRANTPSWSPFGDYIIFATTTGAIYEIYTKDKILWGDKPSKAGNNYDSEITAVEPEENAEIITLLVSPSSIDKVPIWAR